MSSCLPAIAGAVDEVFKDLGKHAPKNHLCLFHVFNAVKDQSKDHVPNCVDKSLFDFFNITYCTSSPICKMAAFLEKWDCEPEPLMWRQDT
jgi:hypothetical protein